MWQFLGQNKILTLLKHELKTGQFPHANLLTGPTGIGKMTLAIDLAQALNCEGEKPPCGNCRVCLRIKAQKHPDINIIDLQSESKSQKKQEVKIGIEYINELQSIVKTPPYEGKYKVFIVNGAENLSIEAANTLLKTLEEPPSQVVIILLATREQAVLPTIVSRCQCIELNPIPSDQITSILTEKYEVELNKAKLLSKLSHGCLGQAFSAIQDEKYLTERARILDTLIELVNADDEKRLNYAGHLINEFSKNRSSLNIVFALWSDWWRDLFLVKEKHKDLIINIDHENELLVSAVHYTTRQIDLFLRELQTARIYLAQNANPRLVLELLILNMPSISISS